MGGWVGGRMLRKVIHGFEGLLQCTADFLVVDACHICGRRHGGEGGRRSLGPLQRRVSAPAEVAVWPGVTLTSNPVCASCASCLETAGSEVVLGWRVARAKVLLRSRGGLTAVGPSIQVAGPAGGASSIRAIAPFRTNDMLLRIIHLAKFARVTSVLPGVSRAVADRAAGEVAALAREPVLVPVPMDRRAVWRRGFNQSEIIASFLGKAWGLPVMGDALVKPRPTRPQSLTSAHERLENVRGAFVSGPGRVEGRDAVLVDDLVTTGSTAMTATAELLAKGAASVTVVSVGRAL